MQLKQPCPTKQDHGTHGHVAYIRAGFVNPLPPGGLTNLAAFLLGGAKTLYRG